jgi:RNA polymerase sigma-70 factor (ECF subfamily)
VPQPVHPRTDPPFAGASAPSDAELVARTLAGDDNAYGVLVRRHSSAAQAVARAVLGELADAEDVCQDVFVRTFERLAEFRPEAHFGRWLLASVRNGAISHRRRRLVRTTDVLGTGPGEVDPPARAAGPHLDAERAELRERLSAALAALPRTHRTVVVMHDVEGWRHREIAAVLGVAQGTSRSMLFDARRRLRERLTISPLEYVA